ncbi:MAG: hypothetical protein IPP40_08135 [bacterium]|nr:hypothetical protein [bacterium]
MYVATGDSTGQNWTPFEVLPCGYYDHWMCNDRMEILGDTASEAAGILGAFSDGSLGIYGPYSFGPAMPEQGGKAVFR